MSTGSTNSSGAATFAKRVAGTFGVRVGIIGCSFLSGIIIARWLGAAGVGMWATLNVVSLLAITVGGFGLQSTVTYLVARDVTRARSVLINAILYGAAVGTLIAVLLAALTVLRPGIFGGVPPALVMIAAAGLPFQMISIFCLSAYLGLERIRTYNIIDLSMQALVLVNGVLTLIVLNSGINGLVWTNTFLSVATSLVVATLAIKATAGVAARPETGLLTEMLHSGLRFFLATAAGMVILRGDLLIVNYFRGTEDAGVYAIATQASLFVHMIPNIVSTILFPRASAKQDETGELTCRVTRHAVLVLLIVCVLAVPCAFILPALYGNAFTGVPPLFWVLLPGVFLLGIETIQVQHFAGLGLPKQIPLYWILVMLLNISLNAFLVPRFGALAAASVSTLSYGVIFILVARLFRSVTGRSYSDMFLIRGEEIAGFLRLHKTAEL
jgi:O-antigen/teichoic acid export membrane protein